MLIIIFIDILLLLLFLLLLLPGQAAAARFDISAHSADGLPSAAEMFHYVQINNIHAMVSDMHSMMTQYENERLRDEQRFREQARRDNDNEVWRNSLAVRNRAARAARAAAAAAGAAARSRSRSRSRSLSGGAAGA